MGQFYKIKQFFQSFFYWNKHREVVFFIDGELLRLNYIVSFKVLNISKVIENRFLGVIEEIIAKHIKKEKVLDIVSEKEKIAKLIYEDIRELMVYSSFPISGIELVNLVMGFNFEKSYFISKDGKKVSVFFCFDKNVISDDYLNEATEYVKKNISNNLAENIGYALCNTETLFSKMDICVYV